VRAGHVESVPVSHVDLYPTIIEGAGSPPSPSRPASRSLFHAERGPSRCSPNTTPRAPGAAYAGRPWKLIHHWTAAAVFNLEPIRRAHDSAGSLGGEVTELEGRLRDLRSGHDMRPRADQRAKSEYWGSNDAIRKVVYTPPPGVKAEVREAGA
jgi:arylsulfatase A-like enzyme